MHQCRDDRGDIARYFRGLRFDGLPLREDRATPVTLLYAILIRMA